MTTSLDFLSYHCIIHQEVLEIKRPNTKAVMDTAFKIVNSVRGKSLQRRLFQLTLEKGNQISFCTQMAD
jgi:hypothetical protein